MKLHEIFQDSYYKRLEDSYYQDSVLQSDVVKVYGLEIWSFEPAQHEVREILLLSADDVEAWLNQQGPCTEPDHLRRKQVVGRLRLLCLSWTAKADGSQPRPLPFMISDWKSIMSALHLPSLYVLTLPERRQVAPHVIGDANTSGSPLSFICQSPSFLDSFTTMTLSFDAASKTMTGFLGFQRKTNEQNKTPGVLLLESIKYAGSQVNDPMLIPVLLFDAWVRTLQHEQRRMFNQLREVQKQTGLLHDYLRRPSTDQEVMHYDTHKTLVQVHAYLTNGMADFLQNLAPSLMNCADKTKEHFSKIASQQQSQGNRHLPDYDNTDTKHYIESLRIRAESELQQRQRMLDRIAMYLQVLYNLMQQQIADETLRDSSAMKSIVLLTMVFLPATAIATVISPFITITSSNRIEMTGQFWIFWAIAGPTTVIVVVTWILWIQRSDIARLLMRWNSRKLKDEEE